MDASGWLGVLDPQGPVAAAERTILVNATLIMCAVIVPVMVLTIAFAWWFRAGNPWARRIPDWAYSGAVEVTVWSIPILVVLFLAGIAWIGAHELDPRRPLASKAAPLQVQVISLDWKWLFVYPELGVASVDRLVVPAGVPVRFRLTSATVMNSFFVPQLGSQIYTMGGMVTELNLQADRPGVYPGRSTNFSGDGFAWMHFETVALARPAFDAWLAAVRARRGPLDAAQFAALSRSGVNREPLEFGAVVPRLFEQVVDATASGRADACAAPAAPVSEAPRCKAG